MPYLRAVLEAGRVRRHRADYDRQLADLGDAGWYWHLYLDGEKVNGGLCESREEARAAAEHAVSCDWTSSMHTYYGFYGSGLATL
jgi:hypothetical protein